MPITIIFSHKSSILNRKLIKFFEINLYNLNKTSVTFEFEVAHPRDADKYAKRGINSYPTLLDNSTSITGVEKIMAYLQNIIKRHNTKILNKTDNDRLDDFWKDTIGKIELDAAGNVKADDDDSELSNVGDNLHHKIQEAFEQRNSGSPSPAPKSTPVSTQSTRSNNLVDDSPSKTIKRMKAQGRESSDDILMAKFFENQEESIS